MLISVNKKVVYHCILNTRVGNYHRCSLRVITIERRRRMTVHQFMSPKDKLTKYSSAKRETLIQLWFIVGTVLQTVDQHQNIIGPARIVFAGNEDSCPNIGVVLGHRPRRRPNNSQTSARRLVLVEYRL